jgi:hypothetical protein
LASAYAFRRFVGIPITFFPNNTLGGFVEIGVQGCLQLEVFRPTRIVHKGPWSAHHHGGVTLALIAIRIEPVPPTKCGKETSLPLIGHGELRLRQRLRFDGGIERLPEPFNRSSRSLAFTRGRDALE